MGWKNAEELFVKKNPVLVKKTKGQWDYRSLTAKAEVPDFFGGFGDFDFRGAGGSSSSSSSSMNTGGFSFREAWEVAYRNCCHTFY